MTNFEDKISLMIPAYLRGDLSPSEMEQVESIAAKNPEIAADIEFQKNLKANLKAKQDSFEPGELGWARLSKAMKQTDFGENKIVEPPKFWRYTAAILAVAAIGQAGVLAAFTMNKDEAPQYITVSDELRTSNVIKIGLHPDSTTKTLTETLHLVDGTIIQGPSSLGLYQVQFKSETVCLEAIDRLKALDAIIDTITPCE